MAGGSSVMREALVGRRLTLRVDAHLQRLAVGLKQVLLGGRDALLRRGVERLARAER